MEKIIKVSDLISQKYIIDIKADTKVGALNELLAVICENPNITNRKVFEKAIFDREKLMSTGIGYGVAVPHARDKSVKDFVIAIGRKQKGLEYESIDDKPVKLIFMIGASDNQDKAYIKLLSRLVLRLKNRDFFDALLQAANPEDIYDLIHKTK
ncbi:PTS sugar transporter subunit IIA [Candidatus Cloacimonadota bacterium]